MKRGLCSIVAALALAGASDALAGNGGDAVDPPALVRTLQFLQDDIAHGEVESDDARRKLIDLLGQRLLSAAPQTWRSSRNVEAALLYVLNGGNPAVLSRLPTNRDDALPAQLVEAVAAYAGGSQAEARKLWGGIDLQSLPVALVGPAALVKANVMMDEDPAMALRYTDIARLESPGTLVEEAAIRRGIEIAAKLGDSQRFEFLSVRYATRFPHSMYGAAFRGRFSESYLTVASKAGADAPRLDEILSSLGEADRRAIFLQVARLAVLEARLKLARNAAENAALLSQPGTLEMYQATLYRSAARAVSDDPGNALAELAALPKDELPQPDRELLDAVRAVVAEIRQLPAVPPAGEAPDAQSEEGSSGSPSLDELASRAETSMAAASETLQEIDR